MAETVDRSAAMDREQRELEQHNDEVRSRQYCKVCSTSVRDRDYSHKFAAAGGALTGPFCSRECYWTFLTGGTDD